MSRIFMYLFFLLVVVSPTVEAQTNPISLNSVFVYSVRVTCSTGQIPIGIASQGQVGIREELFRTEVTIQNPLDQTARVSFRAVLPRSGTSPGGTSQRVDETLDGMAARSLGCGDFITVQNPPSPGGPGNEGFLVIESRTRLQVAAVYSQRVVKEALKDEISAFGLFAGKKNVFRGGQIPDQETVPLTPVPTGADDNSPARDDGEGYSATASSPSGPNGVDIPIQQYGTGPVHAAAMGVGVGVGVGRGIGLGIGAGGGVDVEYVEPIVVPRRLILTLPQPAGSGG